MSRVMIEAWQCNRCNYVWLSQWRDYFSHTLKETKKPITCPNPKCRSPYWDIPKKEIH